MRLLDRYLLRHFMVAYLTCFASLLALYVVIDLFTKLDEFTEYAGGPADVFHTAGTYYLYRLPWLFQRLSGIVALLSALFTFAWLERQNEVTPFLAAGVPARRLLYPILLATLAITGVTIANREWLVPQCAHHLQFTAKDPRGRQALRVIGGYDANLIHFEGRAAFPERGAIEGGRVTLPSAALGHMVHLTCLEMVYRPPGCSDESGWQLNAATPEQLDSRHPAIRWLGPGCYFLATDMNFERLIRNPNAFQHQPTSDLLAMLRYERSLQRRGEVIALVHRRFTAPLLELILVLFGVPFIFARRNENIYMKLGLGLIVYGIFHGMHSLCDYLASTEQLDPILAAWIPVLIFGPAALARVDGMET